MEKETVILVIAGIAICTAFLGFLAYLSFLSRNRQEPTPTSTPTYITIGNGSNPTLPRVQEEITKTREVAPRTPHMINFHLNDAGTWYKIDLPRDMISWTLKARGGYALNYSYEPSHSTINILDAGERLMEDTMPNRGIRAIYVMCETPNVIVDAEVWRND